MARGRKPRAEPLPPPKSAAEQRERDELIRSIVDTILETRRQQALLGEKVKAKNAHLRQLGLKTTDVAVAMRLYELELEDRNKSLDGMKTLFRALEIGQQFDFVTALQAEDAQTEEDETDEAAAVDADPTGQAEGEDAERVETEGDGLAAAVAGDAGEEIRPEADHGDVGDAPATDAELDTAGSTHRAGHDVGYAGGSEDGNPHRKRSAAAKIWAKGWQVGASKRIAEADDAGRAQHDADVVAAAGEGEAETDLTAPGAPWDGEDAAQAEAVHDDDAGSDDEPGTLAALSAAGPVVEAVAA